MKVAKTIYGVSPDIFYIIAVFAWNLCRKNLIKLRVFKASYTEETVTRAIEAIEEEKNLKSSRQAIGVRKAARVHLQELSKSVRENWQFLKGYISTASAKDMVKIEMESAGSSLYKKGETNWSAVNGLIGAANALGIRPL